MCTIVARNYLPHARVLAESVHRHHDQASVFVLVIDGDAEPSDAFTVLRPADIGLAEGEFHRMAAIYDVTELACAVKPWLLAELLRREPMPVLYLDPDMEVLAPIEDLAQPAANAAMVLTPHVLETLPRDGLLPDDFNVLAGGVYNLGFVAVGPTSGPFLEWWQERLRRDCISDVARGLFVDQRWVDLAAHVFGSHVVTDRGVNVAYWNVFARPIFRSSEGAWLAGGVPLRLFHYSGYDPDDPSTLTRHHVEMGRVRLDDEPALRALCDAYGSRVKEAGLRAAREIAYGYAASVDGRTLTPAVRRRYRAELIAAEGHGAALPDPFAANDVAAFAAWAGDAAPATNAPRVIAYLYAAPGENGDTGFDGGLVLQEAAIRSWCDNRGWGEPEWFSDPPVAPGGPQPNAATAVARARATNRVLFVARSEALPGGLGEVAALTREALSSGFDVAAVDIGLDTTTPAGRVVADYLCSMSDAPHPTVSVPLPPAELRYRVAGAGNPDWFDWTGHRMVQDYDSALAVLGTKLEAFEDILDFGCGCGRVMRHLSVRVAQSSLTGVDIDAPATDWLASALPDADVRATEALPPLPFGDGSFDLVLGCSVFSHLDQRYQDAWLQELRRVTQPGAVLLLTVNGPLSFDWHASGPMRGLRDTAKLRRRLRRRGFVFWDGDGWERWFPDFYHSAWHTPAYIRRHWSKWFNVVDVLEGKAGSTQDLVLLER